MPKQVIVIMDDHYPFGQCEQSTNDNTKVLVRKIYEVSIQERNKLLQRSSILRKLKSQQLIKIQSVLEEDQTVHFLFQYVPIRLQTWISNINDQFIQNFRDQLIKFSSYLANNFIKIDFKLKNIGMDHDYGAKYFVDANLFVYDPTLNKERLKSQYIRDISNLFKPYIQNNAQQQQKTYTGTHSVKTSQNLDQKQSQGKHKNAAISPPTYNDQPKDQGSTKTKQKLEKYYQQMNASMDVQNQKILQEFMNVLDDQEEQQEHRPKSSNQKRTVPAQYQYGYDPREQDSRQQQPIKTQSSGAGSSKQINQNVFQNNLPSQNHLQSQNQNQNQNQQASRQKQNTGIMIAPPKMTKNSQLPVEQPDYQDQVVWKDGDDLQNRIKKAIQNSKSIIKRFKSIKQSHS